MTAGAERRRKMPHRFRQLLAMLVLLAQFALASAQSVSQPPAATAASEAEAAKAKLSDSFATALALAKAQYAGQVDFDKLMKASVLGMLHTLDPYSSFFDPKEWERY